MNQEEGQYQVVLIGIEDNTEEGKESFCREISKNYNISFAFLNKIVNRCPIVLKKNLSQNKAKALVKTLESFGANVSLEEEKDFPPIFLEFQEMAPPRVALESSHLRKTQNGAWSLVGRGKNIFEESLNDVWVLIQVFNDLEDLLTFEEAPIPINPVPSNEAFPFKVVFEGDLSIKRASIAFKSASGFPIPAIDRRKKKEPETLSLPIEDGKGAGEEGGEQIEKDAHVLKPEEISREVTPEATEESKDSTFLVPPPLEESLQLSEEIFLKTEVEQKDESSPRADEEKISREPLLLGLEEVPKEVTPEATEESKDSTFLVPPPLEESLQLSEEIFSKTEVEQEEKPFPWIEDFRKSIETYYQNYRDSFSLWFETYQREGGFENSLHALMTILAYARFNQSNQSEKALENTQRVIRLMVQSNVRLEEVPPLERTQFFSGEDWRDLFLRALPKLQQVANNILKRDEWNALDLERLIRVIPHMSDKNSRLSVRWMHEQIPDAVKIDFSNTPINIGESLYRVASRLGVVNPQIDYYQGRDSIGDMKIQSFAKLTFPVFPLRIEDPMTWVGRKEGGGHCFTTHPRCEGCLFEHFCPKLCADFDPSGRGMRGR